MSTNPLQEQVREVFGRMVYTHKIHEKERERLSRLAVISKWVNIVVSAATLGGVVTALGAGSVGFLVASVCLATLNVGHAFVQLSFDPLRDAGLHRAAAKQLLVVRNGYESLVIDMMSGAVTDDEARARRAELEAQAQDAYRLAPDSSGRAYASAQKALKLKEDLTFSSDEIDAFLPEGVRRNAVQS